MTVGANSYGSASDVAALTWVWVAEANVPGVYDTTTLPTLTQVEAWIDQISAIANTSLRKWGFTIPLTDATDVLAVKSVVVGFVADMANYSNSTGRFFTERALASGVSPFAQIRQEIEDWVASIADGLESERDLSTTEDRAFSHTPTKSDGYHDEAITDVN